MVKKRITHVTVSVLQYHFDDNDVDVTVSRVADDGTREARHYSAYDWKKTRDQRTRFFERGLRMQRALFERSRV
jgi:hypothetical protein